MKQISVFANRIDDDNSEVNKALVETISQRHVKFVPREFDRDVQRKEGTEMCTSGKTM